MTDSEPGAAPQDDPTASPGAGPTGTAPGTPPGLALAWRAPLLAYGVTLAVGVVLGVLALLALSSGDAPEEVSDVSSAAEGVLAWIAMPFQLVAMALGGRISAGDDTFSISVRAMPLVLTATYVVMLARAAGAAESRIPSRSRTDRAITSGAAAVGTAVVVAVLTRLLALRSDGTAVHALSVSLVVGTLLLTFLGDLAGRELRSVGLPAVARRWASPAIAWLAHLGIWMVVSFPVLFVVSWVQEGFRAALALPLWWPIGGMWTYVLGHLSGIGTSGFYAYAWSGDGVLTPLALLLGAVVATVFAATVWHVRATRDQAELAAPASWVPLPVAFAIGGVVVTLLSMVSIGGGGFGVSGAFTVMPAAWTCLLLALWGVAAEGLSRTVAPRTAALLPAPVVARLQAGLPERPDAPVTPAEPMTPEQARKVRRIALLVGGALAVVVAAAIAVSVISSTYFTPERAAQDYVDAIADGDVDAVADSLPSGQDLSSLLLTEEIYDAATDRPTDYAVGDVSTLGDSAMVEVTAENGVGGDSYVSLEKGDKKFGIFQEWDVTEGLTSTLNVSSGEVEELTVNGVTVTADDAGYATYAVLPGTYEVDLYAGSDWIDGAASEVAVPLGEYASAETSAPEPSDAFVQRVDEEVGAWLEECMTSTEVDPDGCPQEAYVYGDVRNVAWELTQAPEVDYEYFDTSFPMTLYVSGGSATATYEVDESYGFGPKDWNEETEESSLDFSVEVDLSGDDLEVTPDSY